MNVTVSIEINASKTSVWQAISDIDNSQAMISSILNITVLNKPAEGLVGFKWQETREMFGKEAKETMWVTDAVENDFYATRAESHGSVYITRLSLSEAGKSTRLTMSFDGVGQNLFARLLSFLMSRLIIGSMTKALNKDLTDIKDFVEKKSA